MKKSEKRKIGEERQARNRQESIESGLRAQRRDQERRALAAKKKAEAEEAEKKKAATAEALKKLAPAQ